MPSNTLPASTKIKQVRSLVDSGMSSSDARRTMRTGFRAEMPNTIPAEALNGNYSFSDLRAMRDNREQADMATAQFNTDYSNLTSRIGNTKLTSPFVNPEETLNRLLLRGTTDTQASLDTGRQTQADTIRGFATDYTQAGRQARTDLGIPELQTNLADTRNRIAERQVKLRETLRDFETNAERRGVAREFVESEKAKVQSDAASELADLSIIESAQLGNLQEARAEVETILAEKRQAFEFENAAIEAEIKRLEGMDTRESQARSEQLQIALQERTRNIETALANEKEQREYMLMAASKGADQGTLMAIRNAKSPQEAAFLAAPFTYQPKTPGAPELQNFGTNDNPDWRQFNTETRTWDKIDGVGGITSTAKEGQQISEANSKLDSLLGYAAQAKELASASGASGLSKIVGGFFVGDTKFKRLENLVDTMKVNLLTMNTDPAIKKFFGPQMSNRDTELMTSAGTTLNAERMSPDDMKKEIVAYEDVVKRAKAWTYLGGGGVLTVQLTDPKTGAKETVPVSYETLTQAANEGVLISF